MSKKRFNDGLDSVFTAEKEQGITVGSAFLMADNMASLEVKTVERRAGSTKNFLSDLDSLLNDALQESINDFNRGGGQAAMRAANFDSSKSKSTAGSPASDARPGGMAGIDALIRQTIDVNTMDLDEAGKKRITFSVDRTKLDKLKTIARLEKSYLKDVLANLIDGYIQEYAKQKGVEV